MPDAPRPAPEPVPPGLILASCAVGAAVYIGLAWLIERAGFGFPSVLPPGRRLLAFGVACAVGLGSAALSFPARRAVASGRRPGAAVFVGIGLAEVPAVLGLVFFVFSHDATGFLLLLGAALAAMVLHAVRPPGAAG